MSHNRTDFLTIMVARSFQGRFRTPWFARTSRRTTRRRTSPSRRPCRPPAAPARPRSEACTGTQLCTCKHSDSIYWSKEFNINTATRDNYDSGADKSITVMKLVKIFWDIFELWNCFRAVEFAKVGSVPCWIPLDIHTQKYLYYHDLGTIFLTWGR